MLNRTFSIKKGREISAAEAKVELIRRRLTNPLGRKRNTLEQSALPSTLQTHSAAMPKNKSRRGESNGDWEADRTEESYANSLDGNSSSNRAGTGGVGENGDDIDNDHIYNNSSGGRPRQNRGGLSQPQPKYKHSLGPWSEAVNETVRSLGAAHQAIKDLQGRFASHLDDLGMMEETRDSVKQLKDECIEKDEEIRMLATTVTTLTSIKQKTEEKIEHEKKDIERDKKELELEKAKLEKRVTATVAEERIKLRSEVDKLVKEHGQSHDKRRKELEDDFTKQREENNKRVTALETENRQLSTTVEEQKVTIKDQAKKLEKVVEQCDVLERAKDSVKREKLARETELEDMKKEFALKPKSKEYFKWKFAEICGFIENISLKYFSEIDGKDLEKVHEDLVAADPCFESVPVDDTEDSRNLRIAHAQRIISNVIYEYLWQPFRSEFTMSHPEFNDLLVKILDELEKSSQGGRVSNVWTALTTQALQSLPADPLLSRASEFKEPLRPTSSGRAEGVVSKVLSVLSPLVSSSQYDDLRIDLLKLAKPAIDIWNDAQTGELKVTISPSLKPAHREEWRSQKFDLALPSDDHDGVRSDIMSTTHPRIFTLFPRVVAWEAAGPIQHDAGLPGSWPSESDQGHRRIETCIHPGVGLPEWSPLVVRGKEEQELRNEYLEKALETAKKQLHSNRRLTGHGRRESMGSLTSTPSSPSQQWKFGGAMKFPERSD